MSVWRIEQVDDKTRNEAQAAADKAGMPLGAWLEQAIMRRVSVAKPVGSTAPVAPTPPAADNAAPPAKPRRVRKRKAKPAAVAPAATQADAAMVSSTAPLVAKQDVAPPIKTVAPDDAATPAPLAADAAAPAATEAAPPALADAPPAAIASSAAVVPVEDAAPADVLPGPEAETPPDIFPQEEAEVTTTPREVLVADEPPLQPPLRRFPSLPVLGAGLVVVLAVGGYFLFGQSDDESDGTQTPATSAANPAPKPAPSAAPAIPPAAPPSVASVPSPAPATAPTPTPSPAPANVPAPIPGVQPSLLVPVPGGDNSPGAAGLAPPATDFPTRPGPVVAQIDSIASLTARAENGDVNAQIELGKRYMQGTGTAKDPAAGLHWLEKAAEAGNGPAQFNVAVMYESGIGTAVDPVKAMAWYRKAASQPIPVPTAVHNLALLLVRGGGGIAADPVQGRVLMTQAAELGQPESEFSLALMYFHGVGGPVDKVAALSWLALAARSNNPQYIQAAQELVATMNEDEKAKAQALANQHVKRINDTIARLRAIANPSNPTATPAPPPTPTPAGKPLDRAGIAEIQTLLGNLKLFAGPADGAANAKTEQAIRDYQAMAGLPIDGKATPELLGSLRDVAGAVSPKKP